MDAQHVTAELKELELSEKNAAALFLVPGAVVAWADNKADMNELEAIASRHAQSECSKDMLCVSEEARHFIYYNFVYQRPERQLFEKVLGIIHRLIESCDTQAERNRICNFIAGICVDVARSSGDGIFGFLNRVDANEKQAITDMADEIDLRRSPNARQELAKLGL